MAILPSGVFALTYGEDRALIRTRPQWLAFGLLILLLVLLPLLLPARYIAVANEMLVMAVVVTGLQITLGYAGQVNLGQAAFMGIGAFAAVVSVGLGIPSLLTIPIAGIAAAAFGFLFGLSAVRIKGFYLALTTVAAQTIFHFAVINLPVSWLGGPNGLKVPAASLFGLRLSSDTSVYYVALIVTAIMLYGAFGIVRGRFGRAFVAVRDDDVAAGMMGIGVVGTKALAFLVGAFYAGVGGALWAYFIRFVSVDQFTLFNSVWMIAMVIVGGLGSIVGGLVGVTLIVGLQEIITSVGPGLTEMFPSLSGQIVFASMNVVLGGLIALCLIVEPKGLMHRWELTKHAYRIWPFPYL